MKKHIPLIFALSIPILLIIGVVASIYLPSLFIKPQYSFVFSIGGDYAHRTQYSVSGEKLIKNSIATPDTLKNSKEPELYRYDIQKNISKIITFEEAQSLNLDPNPSSPDGFELTYGSEGGGGVFPFFFWSDYNYGSRYLKGHGVTKKINLPNNSSYGYNYYGDFRFLGWIKK